MNAQNGNPNWLGLGLSCLTHFLLLAPAVYIVILCTKQNNSLFLWHPACLSIGCGLLMTEAIFGVAGDTLLSSKISRTRRIKLHWVLHSLGLFLLVIGFSVIVANKNNNYSNHFTSSHGKLGLSTFIITLVVALGGVLTLFSGLISQKLSLASVKLIHACGGIISMILLLASLITGVYRPWWPSGIVSRDLTVAAYVIGGSIILLKPVYGVALKIRGFFN